MLAKILIQFTVLLTLTSCQVVNVYGYDFEYSEDKIVFYIPIMDF